MIERPSKQTSPRNLTGLSSMVPLLLAHLFAGGAGSESSGWYLISLDRSLSASAFTAQFGLSVHPHALQTGRTCRHFLSGSPRLLLSSVPGVTLTAISSPLPSSPGPFLVRAHPSINATHIFGDFYTLPSGAASRAVRSAAPFPEVHFFN